MICDIIHRFEYRYSGPVFLDPHLLYLMPRTDASQKLKHFELRIDPAPVLVTEILDSLGNPAHEVWFKNSSTGKLSVEVISRVETLRQNPFDYLLRNSSLRLPLQYSEPLEEALKIYKDTNQDKKIKAYADESAARAGNETVGFLSELCLRIHREMTRMRREEGLPWPAVKTLMDKKGSCRDLAVLFIACCRSQGLAARFTSGYAEIASNRSHHDLHAWPEVYVEGGGWRGYDPSTGLAVSDQHVALASAHSPVFVTPIAGGFRSGNAKSVMHTEVSIFFDETAFTPAASFRRLHQSGDTVRS